MALDAARKNKLEQQAVLALLGLFSVVIVSSLKSIGIFGGGTTPPATPQVLIPDIPKEVATLPETIRGASAEATVESIERQENRAAPRRGPAIPVITYAADQVRDPLIPLLPELSKGDSSKGSTNPNTVKPAIPSPPAISIQGVIWGGGNPKAIINGNVYAVGDLVDGARIVSIKREGITVESQGAMFDLGMSGP